MLTRAKILIIIQLCLAFIALCWYGMAPFMQDLYTYRSRLFLVQTVLGDKELLAYSPGSKDKLQSMRGFVKLLPEQEQVSLQEDAEHYQARLNASFSTKIRRALTILFKELPLPFLSLITITIALSFALLYRIEGAREACWLLPLLSLLLLVDNYSKAEEPLSAERTLYPQALEIERFSDGESAKERFQSGWRGWLQENYSTPLEKAEFNFSHALIKHHRTHPSYINATLYSAKRPTALLFLLFFWNLTFALLLTIKDPYADSSPLDSTSHPLQPSRN